MALGRVWYGVKCSHEGWERFAHICGNCGNLLIFVEIVPGPEGELKNRKKEGYSRKGSADLEIYDESQELEEPTRQAAADEGLLPRE